ncbi:MAG TPA: TIGR02453 family protein [Roseiarcus sp.]|jgi:uncharacterized protein (TIGR02453 family)
MSFQGFGPKALPFFKALKFHQSREWFEANRSTYESAVKGPMGDLVEDVSERLKRAKIPINGDRKSSVFRIHRDVRFSANKDPYKTNAGVALTRSGAKGDPGVLYFHLSPDECFFAAGFHMPEPLQLARLRGAAARAPKAFKAMTAKLKKAGLRLSDEDSLKRAPRGFEAVDDPEIAAAIRFKSLICLRPVDEPAIASPLLVDGFCAFARDALPLLAWGWDALADTR